MKLKKVLFPEILKCTRGNKDVQRVVRAIVDSFRFEEDGIHCEFDSNNDAHPYLRTLTRDINGRAVWALAKKFELENGKTYHICRDFAEALLGLTDRQVRPEHLPNEFIGYLSFPEGLIEDDVECIEGAFVWTGIASNRAIFQKQNWGKRFIWIAYIGKVDQVGTFGTGRVCFDIVPELTIQESIDRYGVGMDRDGMGNEWYSEKSAKAQNLIAKLVINSLLYLNSEDAELLKLTPTHGGSHSHKKKHTLNGHTNEASIPVTAINWDYKRHLPTEDKTYWWDSFPRWQKCGPGLSRIKLVWVKGHEKTYERVRKMVDSNYSGDT